MAKILIAYSTKDGHTKKICERIKQLTEERVHAVTNVVARKPEKNSPDTNPYLKKFLRQLSWKPQELAVFAGKINYPIYTFWDRQVIRFIMWITNGPTDPGAVVEFTDWTKVDDFGRVVADM